MLNSHHDAGGQTILIDTGPDLRHQALREGICRVDAVLYTHTHADHLHGIDDLRAFCQIQRQQIPLYGSDETLRHIESKFTYVLREPSNFWDLPVLATRRLTEPTKLFGNIITPIPVKHGHSDIYGYRIGDIAYITDVSLIPDSSLELLEELDVLLLDCLRFKPHPTHINLDKSLEYASRIGAKQTYLIHMTHEIEYTTVSQRLPSNVRLAYDGLRVSI